MTEITTQRYVRKPLYVEAVQVTVENLAAISQWCQGEVRDYNDNPLEAERGANIALERYIHVRVHNPKNVRQTKAYVGDWILYTDRGYKVYTQKAFKNSFNRASDEPTPPSRGTPEPPIPEPSTSAGTAEVPVDGYGHHGLENDREVAGPDDV